MAEEQKSLKEQLEEAFEQQGAEEAPPETPDTTEGEDNPEIPNAEDEGATENEAAPPSQETAETDVEASDSEEESGDKGEELPPITAPASWTADEKEEFAKLPRAIQQTLARREGDRESAFFQKTEALTQDKHRLAAFDQVLEPYRERFNLVGVEPAQAVQQLLAAQDLLNRNPVEGLKWLAGQYRVDLSQLQQQVMEEQQQLDPNVAVLQNRLSGLESHVQHQLREQNQQQMAAISGAIAAVKDERDASGNLLRPHFDQLETTIVPLVQQMRQADPNKPHAEILKAAYDQAVWTDPEIRGQMLESKQREGEAEQRAKAKAEAEKAKRAAASVEGKPASRISEDGPKPTLREELNAAFSKASNS